MNLNHSLLRHVYYGKWLLAAFWVAVAVVAFTDWWRLRLNLVGLVLAPVGLYVCVWIWAAWQRERVIREAPLPQFLERKLRDTYPHLSGKEADLVERGLRQFFLACNRSKRQFVAMPSKSVDAMWHEFIMHTKAYENWCQLALGYFLHHTPAEALGKKADRNDGLRRAWYWACRDEAINPRHPTRLPLLFALDGKLGIEGGFSYVPDCSDIGRKSDQNGNGADLYCGGSFSDGSASGDGGSFGGAESSNGDGSEGGGDGGGGD